jgi:voltage-gated potassium channel
MPIRKSRLDLRYETLQRETRTPVWISIGWRVIFVLTLVGIAVSVHWFDRAGLRDNYDGDVSFTDVIYFTMISITTTGYGDIAPVSERARLFDALIVTPIRVFVVLVFLGTAYNFVFKRTWDKWRMKLIQKNLHDHIVVCGFGTSGSEAVDELLARGTDPREIVVIDTSPAALERAAACGCAVIEADATRDESLKAVKIDRARNVIVSAGRDDSSILIVLTVRHLAEHVPISVLVRAEDNEILARQAGATTVINPVSFAGLLLAGSCHGPHIADYMADLAATDGSVKLSERQVAPHEIGKPLASIAGGIGVRIYRAGIPIAFWEPYVARSHGTSTSLPAENRHGFARLSQEPGRQRTHPDQAPRRRLCMSPDYAGADVVLVNTCGFLDSAKEESLEAIGEAMAENGRVIVTGCMGKEAETIRARFPGVLAVTGAHQYEEVVGAVHEAAPMPPSAFLNLVPERPEAHAAPLQLSEDLRGLQPSLLLLHHPVAARRSGQPPARRDPARGGEAGRRGDQGTAGDQPGHLGLWRRHPPPSAQWHGREVRAHMTDLSRELGKLGAWVRLHYVYPYPHVDQVIPLMAEGLILPYLDIPFQHASRRAEAR